MKITIEGSRPKDVPAKVYEQMNVRLNRFEIFVADKWGNQLSEIFFITMREDNKEERERIKENLRKAYNLEKPEVRQRLKRRKK